MRIPFAFLKPSSAPATPVLVSSNRTVADTRGGAQITLTGTGLAGVISCEVGSGVSWTSCTFGSNTSTGLTYTMPAKTAGSYFVRVTTAGGVSNTLPIKAWTPAQVTAVDAYLDSRKGITLASGDVSVWADQSSNALSFEQAILNYRPTLVADAFGASPGLRFNLIHRLQCSTGERTLISGKSYFAVAKWTSADNTSVHSFTVPLTIVGEALGAWTAFGASADQLCFSSFNAAGSIGHKVTEGSGLNDGNARLVGVTADNTGPNEKMYVGATQVGPTNTPAGGYTAHGYSTIGNGYDGGDGFAGDIGAVVVVNGVISSGDLADLYEWAKAEFGVA